VPDPADNCVLTPNPAQADNDADGLGDVCDPDDDNDNRVDSSDNCPFVSNPTQLNTDGDSLGNACDPDDDGDTVPDVTDNCPLTPNPSQADLDGDGLGDACDPIFVSTLTAVADAAVHEATGDTNFGSDPAMGVHDDQRSLIRFDLSGTPPNVAVAYATLTLCTASPPAAEAVGRTHQLRLVTSAWTEMGVTWNSQPSASPNANHSWTVPAAGCVTVDVAEDVQTWVSGAVNYGWLVRDKNENVEGLTEYATRESASALLRPSLDLGYYYPPTLNSASPIAAGGEHTCALNGPSGVECWGKNDHGQLGDGTNNDSPVPVGVGGLGSQVKSLAAGLNHTCALTTAGGVKCWGRNDKGQLGNGTTTDSNTPVNVVDLESGVTAIAAGAEHTCAVASSGVVRCWGSNANGQLGNGGAGGIKSTPVTVSGLSNGVRAIAGGDSHTCAVLLSGDVRCWGLNASGQLGDGTTTASSFPVSVVGLSIPYGSVAAGSGHTCAVSLVGTVRCWGRNVEGQLGDGTNNSSPTPVSVAGLSQVRSIAAGAYHTCASTVAGAPYCWGENARGQVGDGTTLDSNAPVAVSGLDNGAAAVAGGSEHSCALLITGTARCWGQNQAGQLGDGTKTDSSVPVVVVGIP
jgi:alpha-tubulin suppressor-like RCC1 family protein